MEFLPRIIGVLLPLLCIQHQKKAVLFESGIPTHGEVIESEAGTCGAFNVAAPVNEIGSLSKLLGEI